jgi:branched-chain amino acid transport system substrate-binding protein
MTIETALPPQAPTRRGVVGALGASAVLLGMRRARAQTAEPIKIGVLTDLSGMMIDYSGMGSVTSAMMAVEDFGGSAIGRPIELLRADHLNKPDVGTAIARRWYDEGVRAIFDIGITSVALSVQSLTREKNRILVLTSTASADMTGSACSPNGIHWTFNNYSQALGAVRYFSNAGAKNWYFLTVDYAYGRNVQRDTTAMIEAAGGKVLGASLHPFETTEFSSSLLEARASKADAIALATTTAHATAIVKQADEFGMRQSGQAVVPLSITLHDVKAIGLQAGQGLIETSPYYWDQNDATRAFGNRYMKRFGRMPNMAQASIWGAVTHYLNAVKAAGTDETGAVLARMHATPINDFMTKDGYIRPDGRVMREMYILKTKTPAESKSTWDLQSVVGTIPATEAFQPPSPACSLNKA